VQNVDAFYIREVGIGTKKTFWLASRKLCWPAMQAAKGELAEGETGTPENQEGQAPQKGRHERRHSKWG